MDFKSIFNGESLTLEQFLEKTKGMKLADLSGGEYVPRDTAEGFMLQSLKNTQQNTRFPLTGENGRGKIKHLSTAGEMPPASYLNRSIAHFPEECKSRAKGF